MILALALVGIFIAAAVIYWYVHFWSFEFYLKGIPGPRALPIIGNAIEYGSMSFLQLFEKYRKQYGPVFRTYIGFFPPTIVITDVKMVEFILTSPNLLTKGRSYKFFKNWLGNGLIVSNGMKWKKHRKMLTSAFHLKILEQFVDVFEKFTEKLIQNLEDEVDNPKTNIYAPLTLATLDIICASAMGTDVKAQSKSDPTYVSSVQDMCRIVLERITIIYKSIDSLYYFTEDYVKEKKHIKIMQDFTSKVFWSRKIKFEDTANNNLDLDGDSDIGMKKKLTFLDTMLNLQKMGNAITDEQICEEIDNFALAGHESTATTCSFALYALANHPEVQENIVNELRSIYGEDKDRKLVYSDYCEMKYLDMVLKETLRLYPPAPLIAREATEDIEYGDITIRKGTELTISIFALQRDPELFEDPERFDPERFTPENQAKRPTFSYVPFSAGKRNCIGQKYAMLELKAVIVKVLRNFKLLPATPKHSLKLGGDIALRSETGIYLRLEKRKF